MSEKEKGTGIRGGARMPELKNVAKAAVAKSYLTGWFGDRQLADKWLEKNKDKLKGGTK